MSPRTKTKPKQPPEYQTIDCLSSGSIWRIERYTADCYIEAELLVCPLCIERKAKEEATA